MVLPCSMPKLQQLLAVFAILAHAAQCADVVEPAALDAALEVDDQCGAGGEVGARCLLNQLQLKAAELEVPGTEDGSKEAGNACTTGFIGEVRSYAPGCLDSCPQLCGVLHNVIIAYLTEDREDAAMEVLCRYKLDFFCLLAPRVLPKCQPLIKRAARFGFELPSTQANLSAELESQCP
eukprot:CAMPEP_0179054642 /NCGR_PEP_ID=MMETSP0796-20121207/22893_1 /TAXON_ID=73915 /ORGANISM="Pyrodinium bahamense, Strain pbaha01" /LENGTH=178 /DNA_ID=CAMNT_0020751275 /DNA_START=53 /DNA_END=589 /DNA_ORIENTATION=-